MKYIFIITLLVALAGCQSKNRIFSENQELSPQVEWLKNDVKTFSITVKETAPSYSLSIAFRYTEGIALKSIKVKVIEVSPSKSYLDDKMRTKTLSIFSHEAFITL